MATRYPAGEPADIKQITVARGDALTVLYSHRDRWVRIGTETSVLRGTVKMRQADWLIGHGLAVGSPPGPTPTETRITPYGIRMYAAFTSTRLKGA